MKEKRKLFFSVYVYVEFIIFYFLFVLVLSCLVIVIMVFFTFVVLLFMFPFYIICFFIINCLLLILTSTKCLFHSVSPQSWRILSFWINLLFDFCYLVYLFIVFTSINFKNVYSSSKPVNIKILFVICFIVFCYFVYMKITCRIFSGWFRG